MFFVEAKLAVGRALLRRQHVLYWALVLPCLGLSPTAFGAASQTTVESPDGRNAIRLQIAQGEVLYEIRRDGRLIFGPSPVGATLASMGPLRGADGFVALDHDTIDQQFDLPWGKTKTVTDRCSRAVATLASGSNVQWEIELRAYDDGVAFRYRLPQQASLEQIALVDEETEFSAIGAPKVLFNTLDGFVSSHESLYEFQPLAKVPVGRLIDCPLLLVWPDGQAAAITEARVRQFAGMYLERSSLDTTTLRCRLSPLPARDNVCVVSKAPLESPWRVVLLAETAGSLLESNLLLCLNDPPQGDFAWLKPGKSTFHWWYGEFEKDYLLDSDSESETFVARHRAYIDFCARNQIAYHAISGDGRAWYPQSSHKYAVPTPDADVTQARPELNLPAIFAYARERGVGIRLWVHWKPLSENLEAAFALYESWGVKGLMVDFLDRDDQPMIEFSERMLKSAARHHLHIQIHGSSKNSGEQRTFPHLFNREGVLNLEYVKWSQFCTPQHSVNVAYTRALSGPVDFHLGGFRSVSRAEFQPLNFAPQVMGTRCHNMALYLIYENPMPMVADKPSVYEDQPAAQSGFEFIRDIPTTWDETKFVMGQPGEYVVLARRSGRTWTLGGITNWTERKIDVPLDWLGSGKFKISLTTDGSRDEALPNEIRRTEKSVTAATTLPVSMAAGGGFVAVVEEIADTEP